MISSLLLVLSSCAALFVKRARRRKRAQALAGGERERP